MLRKSKKASLCNLHNAPITINEAYNQNVRPFIDIIDNLRKLGIDKDISLPTVVVIGDQSSGKSSVLEALSGVEFPRGVGITTRCPIELKLMKGNFWKASISYKTIDGQEIKKEITSQSSISDDILEAQTVITGGKSSISSSVISLQLRGTNNPELSIVDLPGIARITVEGQAKNTCEEIMKLINSYANQSNTIMLCVVPCNQDVATNEALNLASKVDPNGNRTLGVLTKPDLIDFGTEGTILKLARNEYVKLRKGYTIVKCRSQKDIDNNISLEKARTNEAEFFVNHSYFGDLYGLGFAGTDQLAIKLSCALVENIKETLPEIKKELLRQLEETREELKQLGDCITNSDNGKQRFLISATLSIASEIENLCKGVYTNLDVPSDLRICSNVYKNLIDLHSDVINKLPASNSSLLEKVKHEISRHRGPELSPFLSFSVCEYFIDEILQKIHPIIYNYMSLISSYLLNAIKKVCRKRFQGYDMLATAVECELADIHTESERQCKNAIGLSLSYEKYPFTFNDDSLTQAITRMRKPSMNESFETGENLNISFGGESRSNASKEVFIGPERRAQELIIILVNYSKLAFQRVTENVSMAIIYHLLHNFSKRIQEHLINFSTKDSTKALVQENVYQCKLRQSKTAKVNRIIAAVEEMSKFYSSQ